MLDNNFVKPHYNSHCFADLPPTVQYLLTGQGGVVLAPELLGPLAGRYDTIILLLIDAFGWRFFEKYQEHPLLRVISQAGRISRMTCQFPSTTAAHITCLHTGLPPGQSGVYEWQYYEPQLDAVITPLLFSFAGSKERDTLKPTGIDPAQLYPTQTIYQALQPYGVNSFVFQHQGIARSTYSAMMHQGAKVVPYKTLPEGLVNLTYLTEQQTGPAYFCFYFDRVDALAHEYGPSSPQVEAEIDTVLTVLERWFLRPLQGKLRNALFILTADHGQIEVDPKTTLYLNTDPRFKGLLPYLRTDRQGQPLVPAGSARDAFLYIKEAALAEARAFLSERLAGQAAVYLTSELIEAGYFGPWPASPAFLSRVGNLVILPHPHQTVWWFEQNKFGHGFYGHHGGLSPQEMEIPLALLPF